MPADPRCPRCAYDLSGIVESWHRACPLTGLCSECGLPLDWRDILNPDLRLPRWSFEHAAPGRLVRTFVLTLLRALAPPRIWCHIRMEMRIERERLKTLAVCGLISTKLAGIVLLGIPSGYAAFVVSGAYTQSPKSFADGLRIAIWPYAEYRWEWGGFVNHFVSPGVVISLLTVISVPFGFALLPVSLRKARVNRRHFVRIQAYNLAVLPWIIGLWSLVRGLYLILAHFWPRLSYAFWGGRDINATTTGALSLLWALGWLYWSWHAALKHYLRLPHSIAVAAAMIALAFLASTLLVVLLFGHALFY